MHSNILLVVLVQNKLKIYLLQLTYSVVNVLSAGWDSPVCVTNVSPNRWTDGPDMDKPGEAEVIKALLTYKTHSRRQCSPSVKTMSCLVFQLQPTSSQQSREDKGMMVTLPCPSEVRNYGWTHRYTYVRVSLKMLICWFSLSTCFSLFLHPSIRTDPSWGRRETLLHTDTALRLLSLNQWVLSFIWQMEIVTALYASMSCPDCASALCVLPGYRHRAALRGGEPFALRAHLW